MRNHITTKRERVESALLQKHPNLSIFRPGKDWQRVELLKDGSFGFGSTAFALYSNGFNLRGKSMLAPFGLLYENDGAFFSVGYFRKEGSCKEDDGYLFIVAPKGKDAVGFASDFARLVVEDRGIPCRGAYVRFLNENGLAKLEKKGFVKVDRQHEPWHEKAPLEDETYCHSAIKLADALDMPVLEKKGFVPEAMGRTLGRHKNRNRNAVRCFEEFLGKNGLEYRLEMLSDPTEADCTIVREVALTHFEYVWKSGKAIGSTAEDYFGVLSNEIMGLPSVHACIGWLGKLPVSVFVAEKIGNGIVGIYSMLTIRDEKYVTGRLGECLDMTGFGSVARYALLRFFAEMACKGVKIAKLGGSETDGLNRFKWELGAEEDLSFWAFLARG